MSNKYTFYIVGAGGTGGLLTSFLARQIAALHLEKGDVKIVVIDGDVIEYKNLSRQPFSTYSIGQGKASVLASSLNMLYEDVDITYYPYYIKKMTDLLDRISHDSIPVLCGCVDNGTARKFITECFHHLQSCIYIDAGNEKISGEVMLAIKNNGVILRDCKGDLFPNIFEDGIKPAHEKSCMEKTSSGEQLYVTNITAALMMFIYCCYILNDQWQMIINKSFIQFDLDELEIKAFDSKELLCKK